MLVKLLGIPALAMLGFKGVELGAKQFDFVFNIAGSATTKSEVSSISRQIYCTYVIADGRIPQLSDSEWSDYIRQNMSSEVQRDVSRDLWQTPYRVCVRDDLPGTAGAGYAVESAGPDQQFGSDDDIIAARAY